MSGMTKLAKPAGFVATVPPGRGIVGDSGMMSPSGVKVRASPLST